MSRALDSRTAAEYRRKLSDPAYVACALAHVAGLLAEALSPANQPRLRSRFRVMPREHDTNGDAGLSN